MAGGWVGVRTDGFMCIDGLMDGWTGILALVAGSSILWCLFWPSDVWGVLFARRVAGVGFSSPFFAVATWRAGREGSERAGWGCC